MQKQKMADRVNRRLKQPRMPGYLHGGNKIGWISTSLNFNFECKWNELGFWVLDLWRDLYQEKKFIRETNEIKLVSYYLIIVLYISLDPTLLSFRESIHIQFGKKDFWRNLLRAQRKCKGNRGIIL